MNSRLENARNKNIKTFASFFNRHLFMNSDNSDYIFFHINYDSPGEYQFLITLFTWLETPYKGVVLDKYLHKSISLLAINNLSYRSTCICLQLWFSKKLSPVYKIYHQEKQKMHQKRVIYHQKPKQQEEDMRRYNLYRRYRLTPVNKDKLKNVLFKIPRRK